MYVVMQLYEETQVLVRKFPPGRTMVMTWELVCSCSAARRRKLKCFYLLNIGAADPINDDYKSECLPRLEVGVGEEAPRF